MRSTSTEIAESNRSVRLLHGPPSSCAVSLRATVGILRPRLTLVIPTIGAIGKHSLNRDLNAMLEAVGRRIRDIRRLGGRRRLRPRLLSEGDFGVARQC